MSERDPLRERVTSRDLDPFDMMERVRAWKESGGKGIQTPHMIGSSPARAGDRDLAGFLLASGSPIVFSRQSAVPFWGTVPGTVGSEGKRIP